MSSPGKKFRFKYLWILLPLILILVTYLRWDTWFYNPPEPVYSPSHRPDRILLTWSGNPCSTRNVTWQSDTSSKKSDLQLVNDLSNDTLLLPASRSVIRTSGGVAAYFRSTITILHPGQSYAYRVGQAGNWSDWSHFKITCPGDSAFSFIYIGDVQDSINGKTGEVFQEAWKSDPRAAFVLFIGDMIERPHDEYWKEWFRAGGAMFRSVPVIATPGNHEYYKELIQQIDPRWMAHFAFPQNGPKNFKGRICYWDYGNTRLISMDTNGLNILTGLEQRNWLKKVLEQTTQRWKIVFMHHPAFTTSRTHDNYWVRWLFRPLFDKYNVDLVLEGHEHAYGRSAYIPNSKYPSRQGPVYVISHDSPKVYDLNFSPEMDQLASNTQMYQLVNISRDSLNLKAYTKDGELYDNFTLLKNSSGENKLADRSPVKIEERLTPTEDFLKHHSRELGKYNQEMQQWEKEKK